MSAKNNELSKGVKKFSEGLLSKLVDLALVSIYYGLEVSFGGYSKVGLAGDKATDDLIKLNYESLKSSLKYLKRKGFVQTTKEKFLLPEITKEGNERLKSVLPFYDFERVWDGRIYMITYDLPRKKNLQRNLLRNYLKKIGCGFLQYSVWLTPYNPKDLIKDFVKKNNLDADLILISSLGKDGTVGDRDLKGLMDQVYKLSQLNERYLEFLENVKAKIITSKDQKIFSFLSILKDDPQIPFVLLPDDWVGEDAYKLFKKST